MPVTPNTHTETRNLPGPILAATGIVAFAMTLTAVGYGALTLSGLSALAGTLCLRYGIGLMIIEHRRVKAANLPGPAPRDRL
ncbi:hypothetical protein [Nocardia concava]|uniref:hypothetical protein n=1 Tax=Nocardia concava TaxID=257281 RepID=UPI0005952D4C|nr:hypothetical protein [Nocardia concava]